VPIGAWPKPLMFGIHPIGTLVNPFAGHHSSLWPERTLKLLSTTLAQSHPPASGAFNLRIAP
jgi:hypothetical protein